MGDAACLLSTLRGSYPIAPAWLTADALLGHAGRTGVYAHSKRWGCLSVTCLSHV